MGRVRALRGAVDLRGAPGRDDALTAARFGNGVTSVRAYDTVTGLLQTLQEGSALALAYDYHADGRVSHRDDALVNRKETFTYDTIGRLDRWKVTAKVPGPSGLPDGLSTLRIEDYHDDDLGNLTQVFVDSALQDENVYGTNGRPHALTQTTQGPLFYDDHGRQEEAPGRSITWNGYDPGIRRFVTPDPHVTDVLDGQSYNRYSYVGNDPVNRIDPTRFDWSSSADWGRMCVFIFCGVMSGGPINGSLAGSASPNGSGGTASGGSCRWGRCSAGRSRRWGARAGRWSGGGEHDRAGCTCRGASDGSVGRGGDRRGGEYGRGGARALRGADDEGGRWRW